MNRNKIPTGQALAELEALARARADAGDPAGRSALDALDALRSTLSRPGRARCPVCGSPGSASNGGIRRRRLATPAGTDPRILHACEACYLAVRRAMLPAGDDVPNGDRSELAARAALALRRSAAAN